MASSGTPPPSIRQGVRIVPPDGSVTVEQVLLAVGDQVGHEKLSYASRMNKAVVVFLKDEAHVHQLIERGVVIRDVFVQVSPLSVPSTRITVSGVPPFIPNSLIENELRRFGKLASGFRTVSLGCKDPKLRHVQSLRRQVFMFLDSPSQTLEVSFRLKHGDGAYMVYASSGHMKCFECGDVGHKRSACPHKQQADSHSEDTTGSSAPEESATGAAGPAAAGSAEESATGAAGPAAARSAGPGPGAAGPAAAGSAEESAPGAAGPEPGVETAVAGCSGVTGVSGGEGEEQGQLEKQQVSVSESQQGETSEIRAPSIKGQDEVCSQISAQGEEMDYESDTASISEASIKNSDLYSLQDINEFLDETFNKSVKISDYFGDTDKFIQSVSMLKKLVGHDLLDEKRRFRLNKHLALLRKGKKGKTGKTGKIGKKI